MLCPGHPRSLVRPRSCGHRFGDAQCDADPDTNPKPTNAADAASVATELKTKVATITAVTPLTEANDTNKLLGRPGQYTSAAWITDSGATAGATGVDGGAVVGVFATPADAKTRSDYIQGALAKMGPAFGTEWHHLVFTDSTPFIALAFVL